MHLTKKQLGQFFTTNSNYILQGLENYVANKNVVDPFAGNGDLLQWAKDNHAKSAMGYDIDPAYCDHNSVFQSDSILNKKRYEFVITNPPYLNVNKASAQIKKTYFLQNEFEDLYQIALYSLLDSEEGIVIVPINFLSAENSEPIRRYFFEKFQIVRMNYFRKQVFQDTTYNVIAFYYKRKKDVRCCHFEIETTIFPEQQKVWIALDADYGWAIGGAAIQPIKRTPNQLCIYRLTEDHIKKGHHIISAAFNHVKHKVSLSVDDATYQLLWSNIILLNAIDSGSENGKVRLEDIRRYGLDCLVSKPTSRHQIFLIFGKPITIAEQLMIIEQFNECIQSLREQFLSLFMTNYRDNDRKRISFDFAYKLINYLYFQNKKGCQDGKQLVLF